MIFNLQYLLLTLALVEYTAINPPENKVVEKYRKEFSRSEH